MTTKKKNQIFCVTIVILIVIFCFIGCGVKKNVDDKRKNKKEDTEKKTKVEKIVAKHQEENMKLTVDLFKNSYNPRGNVVISPVAVQMSLAFLLNGAVGETQTELINTVGMEASIFNNYLKTYMEEAPKDVRGNINFVNGIWKNSLNEGMNLKHTYESRAVEYLNTEIKSEPFTTGCENVINDWINKATNGMVDKVVTKTYVQNWMYTINVATFAMDWEKAYSVNDMCTGEFNNFNNTKTTVEMMSSVEPLYIEDNEVTGFIKNYYIPRYKFVAIMPDDSSKMDEYVQNWDERKMIKLLEGASNENVKVTFPKFVSGSRINIKSVLAKMGLTQMFSYEANFSGILEDNKFAGLGTMVHASTVVVGKKSSEAKMLTEVGSKKTDTSYSNEIVIDRPFIYIIYDSEESIPVFIGSVKYLK